MSVMAGLADLKKHFPLRDISSVVKLFKEQLEVSTEPDLALLSIVVGAVENSLTCSRPLALAPDESGDANIEDDEVRLPAVEFHIVEALYSKFSAIINGSVDLSRHNSKYANRELVKRVSDVIWNSLTRSYYKDRAHLQNLYSYLTGNKLDCFGVAFAVVSGCQVLGFRDVHLALSEDHAWVVFGEPGALHSAEVTWHGKGNEDKRGQPVVEGGSEWLYLKGHAVECSRPMEVAALVSAINPSLSATSDAVEVALLQQELLWLLYDLGHLARYPMALGNLGDLEEICPTPGRPPCATLFQEAIASARTFYRNHHVYPYTYQGGYFYRHQMFKQAFDSWANAADVIRQYNYSRDDEEIYKEFLEIANELIPHAMKVVSSGHSARSILKNASCFASLLRFYDGICRWEEGSATPVLHIGWAKPLVNTISKFDAAVRARVDITLATEPEPGNPNHSQPRRRASSDTKYMAAENNNNYELIRSLESQVGPTPASPHPSIAALTEACGETLLNPGYLLRGIGSPFTNNRLLLAPAAGSETAEEAEEALLTTVEQPIHEDAESEEEEDEEEERPSLELHSRKMAGLKELLLAEKLNTSAISLQLTAQSQVQVGGRKTRADPVADIVPNFPAAAAAAATVPATATANSATAIPGVRAKRARTRD